MSRSPIPRVRLLGAAALVLACALSLAGVPVTGAQGLTLTPVRVSGPLPEDSPFDPVWTSVRPVEVPLGGQASTQPMRLTPAFSVVRVRALADGTRLSVLLEWDDTTADESAATVDTFADAAAIQLALGTGTSVCMGQQAGGLNIWHWKADWAAAIAGRNAFADAHPNMPRDPEFPTDAVEGMGPSGFLTAQMAGNPRSAATFASSVENLNAIGFGTLTSQPAAGQTVHGSSDHRLGVWRVVFTRDLVDDNPGDAQLEGGAPATAIAFAVWDGSRGDRDGQKSVSTWLALAMPPPDAGPLGMLPYYGIVALALAMAAFLLWYSGRQPGGADPEPPDAAPRAGSDG